MPFNTYTPPKYRILPSSPAYFHVCRREKTEKKLEKNLKGKRPCGMLFMFSRLMELNEFF